MFGIGTTELIIILLVALIILGPTKLPGIARSLGKALGEFRRVTTDVQRTLNLEAARIEEDEREKKKTSSPEKPAATKPAPAQTEPESCVPPPHCVDPKPTVKPKAEQVDTPQQPSLDRSAVVENEPSVIEASPQTSLPASPEIEQEGSSATAKKIQHTAKDQT